MPLLLFVLFLVVPIVELAVIIQVGQQIGVLATLVLLIAVSVAGAYLVRREGTRAWVHFRSTLAAGRLPTGEVIDGALILLGGALMLTPGFVTDVVGLLLVVPPTRALVARALRGRVQLRIFGAPAPRRRRGAREPRPPWATEDDDGSVVDVEVISIERNRPSPSASGRGTAGGDQPDEQHPDHG